MHILSVSDVHLLSEEDPHYELLLGLLEGVPKHHLEAVVLNGDILDFSFGASAYFRHRYRALQGVLSGLSQGGVRVIYVQGNHEFAHKPLGWQGVELIEEVAVEVVLGSGETVVFTHGDRMYATWHYRLYQWIVRHRWFIRGVSLLPQGLLESFCLAVSRFSRRRGYHKTFPKAKIVTQLRAWCEDHRVKDAVCGHFHYPLYELTSRGGHVVCGAGWDRPNAVVFGGEGEGFSRLCFHHKTGVWRHTPLTHPGV